MNAQDKALQSRIDAVNAALAPVVKAQSGLPPNSPSFSHLQAQVTALNNQLTALSNQQNQIRAAVLTPGQISSKAVLPTAPSSPNRLVVLTGGILLGLLAGVSLAMLRHRADDLIRNSEDLFRRTGVPVTTVLSTRLHVGAVTLLPPMSADGRGYARLRNLVTTNLHKSERPVVVVAGVRHGGGPVAANLAASLALAGEDVYLVCADVFGKTATALLGGAPRPGLAEVLGGELDAAAVVRTVPDNPRLRVIGPGLNPDRADALIQTRSPRLLIDQLIGSGAYIVIEAPATADSPDAQTLANMAELAVIVVEVNQTGAREVLDACAQFESMGTQVLGAVVAQYGRDVKPGDPLEEAEPVGADATNDATTDATSGSGVAAEKAAAATPAAATPAPAAPAAGASAADGTASDDAELVPPGPGGRAPR
jgi:Mrp family chromosome partitioning ATPase